VSRPRKRLRVGERVEGGKRGTEDHDTGEVIAVSKPGARATDDIGGDLSDQQRALVAWDTLVEVWHDADELRTER
jgi:hypothetical protein